MRGTPSSKPPTAGRHILKTLTDLQVELNLKSFCCISITESSHAHSARYRMHTSSWVFFANVPPFGAAPASPTTYSVSDIIVAFTRAPTPRSPSSALSTHNIHTPTLPTSTLLTFTCTQVLWFLTCLTRSRVCGVTTRPD